MAKRLVFCILTLAMVLPLMGFAPMPVAPKPYIRFFLPASPGYCAYSAEKVGAGAEYFLPEGSQGMILLRSITSRKIKGRWISDKAFWQTFNVSGAALSQKDVFWGAWPGMVQPEQEVRVTFAAWMIVMKNGVSWTPRNLIYDARPDWAAGNETCINPRPPFLK
jgi:hypothetical protein